MPIYEYVCDACGEQFAKLQKMGEGDGETACPQCGSHEVKRRISGCSIGSGSKDSGGPACGSGGG